jgi:peroxin-1
MTQIHQAIIEFHELSHQYLMSIQIHPLHLQSSPKTIDTFHNYDDDSKLVYKEDESDIRMKDHFLSLLSRSSIDTNIILHDRCIIQFQSTNLSSDGFEWFQVVLVSSDLPGNCEKDDIFPIMIFQCHRLKEMIERNYILVCESPIVKDFPLHITSLNLLPRPCFVGSKQNAVFPGNLTKGRLLSYEDHDTRAIIGALYRQLKRNMCHFRNIIIFGPHGSGKTYQCLMAAAYMRLHCNVATVYLDCNKLHQSSNASDILLKLSGIFHRAMSTQPSLVILDDLDILLPNVKLGGNLNMMGDKHQSHTQSPLLFQRVKLIADHLIFLMGSLPAQILVVCTTLNEESIYSDILPAIRFSERIVLAPLSPNYRLNLFSFMLKEFKTPVNDNVDLKYMKFPKKTEGYRPLDIRSLAMQISSNFNLKCLREEFSSMDKDKLLTKLIDRSLQEYIPLSQKTFKQQCFTRTIKWNFIGGLFRAKDNLEKIILRPVRYSSIYIHSPISLPRGILLYGPPGCGKSCIVPALADHIGFNLVTCRGPEILDKYIGMSEARVRQLFEEAYVLSPCILFFDDLDALGPKRGRDSTGATDRVVNQLLTYLDGVEGRIREEQLVYIIAATSRPDKVDPALLRPGRLESHIYIGPPECMDEWIDLFSKAALSRNDVSDHLLQCFRSDEFLLKLTEMGISFEKMTPADVKAAFDNARVSSICSQTAVTKAPSSSSGDILIHPKELAESISKVCDRTNRGSVGNLKDIYDTFRYGHCLHDASKDSSRLDQHMFR